MKKIVYVGFAFTHHLLTHAGYQQIKQYIPYYHYIDCQSEYNFICKIIKRHHLLDRLYIKLFGSRLWLSEFRCIFYSIFHKDVVFHVIYSENILKYLYLFIGKKNQIASTYHLPYETLVRNKTYVRSIQHSNYVILMTSKNLMEVRKLKGDNKVYYIPHGIDTTFYNSGLSSRDTKHLLMVGNMLRNFKFANKLFEYLLNNIPDLKITIVTKEENYQFFSPHPQLYLCSNISNEEILNLYQKATLLVLPMFSFTANNTLLEALSCGCPAYIISDYVDTSYNNPYLVTEKPNLEKNIYYIKSFLNRYVDNSIEIRKHILDEYSWEHIGTKVYQLLLQ